jgi:hypothetical protein
MTRQVFSLTFLALFLTGVVLGPFENEQGSKSQIAEPGCSTSPLSFS